MFDPNTLTMYGAGLLAAAALTISASSASAQSVDEFYSQNDITLIVGTAPGGSTDFFARAVAPYLTKHMPGSPDIVVQNKPGAGGFVAAMELQHTAPKDGTVIGTLQRNNYIDPLLRDEQVNFDPREVSSLGSVATNTYVIFSYGDEPITLDDVTKGEMILACTGAGSANATFPRLLNRLAGTKFNCITGYAGTEEQMLAIERGEAQGRATGYTTTTTGVSKEWREAGMLHYVVVFAPERIDDLPDVPTIMELIEDEESRSIFRFLTAPDQFGRPFAAPGGIPEERLAALREAFARTAADPDFIAEMEKRGEMIEFMSGEELQATADELMSTPAERIEKIKALLAAQ